MGTYHSRLAAIYGGVFLPSVKVSDPVYLSYRWVVKTPFQYKNGVPMANSFSDISYHLTENDADNNVGILEDIRLEYLIVPDHPIPSSDPDELQHGYIAFKPILTMKDLDGLVEVWARLEIIQSPMPCIKNVGWSRQSFATNQSWC